MGKLSQNQPIRSCAVFGGGVAGLAAAERLTAAGVKVTLFERETFLGGLCRRVQVGESYVDLGPHNVRTGSAEVLAYWKDLLGDHLESRPVLKPKILFLGRLLSYPIETKELLSQLPFAVLMRAGVDYFARYLRGPKQIESYRDWVVKNYGKTLAKVFFEPLTEKIWCFPAEKLDANFGKKRIPKISVLRALLGLARSDRSHPEHPLFADIYYPREGVYEICQKIAERVISRGGRILTQSEVCNYSLSDSNATVHWVDRTSGEKMTETFDYILSSIPHNPGAKGTEELVYRGTAFLFLEIPASDRLSVPLIYCADRDLPFNRVTDFSYFSTAIIGKERNVICIEYNPGSTDDVTLEKYADQIVESLKVLGLLKLGRIFARRIDFEAVVYPVYVRGYGGLLAQMFAEFAQKERLLLLGRQALYQHINIDGAIESGFRAVELALTAPFDAQRKLDLYRKGLP